MPVPWIGWSVLGVAAVGVYVLLRRRRADPQLRRAVATLCVLLAAQGAVGALQYALEVPAEIVWVHVSLAALTWLSLLWAAAAGGRLAPQAERAAQPRAVAAR